jgi:hypothetical protein
MLTPTLTIALAVSKHTALVSIAGGGHGYCLFLRSGAFYSSFSKDKNLAFEILD